MNLNGSAANIWVRSLFSNEAENKAKTPRKQTDDLDQVTGTAEDEFTEKIAHIRERELLFGERSLLGGFAPMITFICTNNRSFSVFL